MDKAAKSAEPIPREDLPAIPVENLTSLGRTIRIGDIEVVGASRPFIDELAAWADAYQAAVGEKLAFMQTDVAWSELAMQNLIPLSTAMKARSIPLAVIYNADDSSHTDESWQQSAESHIAEIETVLHIHPDIAVFDSWTLKSKPCLAGE